VDLVRFHKGTFWLELVPFFHEPRVIVSCCVQLTSPVDQDHSYVSTTIKGARVSNEDTTFSDGRFFSLFDGHGGKAAARVGRDQLAKHFHDLMKSGNRSAPAPKPVQVCLQVHPWNACVAFSTSTLRFRAQPVHWVHIP